MNGSGCAQAWTYSRNHKASSTGVGKQDIQFVLLQVCGNKLA
jgi:hypothetical protein